MTGDYYGHIFPGCIFLLIGLWWLCQLLRKFKPENSFTGSNDATNRTFYIPVRTWYSFSTCGRTYPIEPWLKCILPIAGIIIELCISAKLHLYDDNGEFMNINDFSHSAMYAAFCLQAIVEVISFYQFVSLPKYTEHALFALAFLLEGFLFHFHLDHRTGLDKRIHTFAYIAAYLTAIVMALEPYRALNPWMFLLKVLLLLIQGTWFFQIAHSLYGSIPWQDDSIGNIMVLPVIFAWHVLFWVTVVIIVAICSQKCYFRARKLEGEEEEDSIALTSLLTADGNIQDEEQNI